ncbi:glycosyltransferase, partial [bacterium]|nr:glycosyltransferase [bacterium]
MLKVSIVIAAYNESNRLPQSLEKISAFKSAHPELDLELILVDDGSKDSTWEIIQNSPIVTLKERLLKNRGKGFALRTGAKLATTDLIYLC